MIYAFIGITVGVSLLLGLFIDVHLKLLPKEERKKKGLLVINGKRIL
jgi:hypothetical protein